MLDIFLISEIRSHSRFKEFRAATERELGVYDMIDERSTILKLFRTIVYNME